MDGNLVGIPLLTCSPTSDIGFFYHIIKHSTLSQVHTFIFAQIWLDLLFQRTPKPSLMLA
jgi:hypothetical protein